MRKRIFTFLLMALSLALSATAVFADNNCSNCHHVDFQPNKVNRAVCGMKCHINHYGMGTVVHTDYGDFKSLESATSSDAAFIHSKHTEFSTSGSCMPCHGPITCKACHTSVNHGSHGNTSYTGPVYDYADGYKYYKTTNFWPEDKPQPQSCTLSQCHKWWTNGGPVLPTSINRPLCLNCHEDPHGLLANSAQQIGVTTTSSSNPSNSDIKLKWSYQSGDTLAKSLDGLAWTSLTFSAPSPGSFAEYIDANIPNWSIVYYKITSSSGDENFFPVFPPGSNAHTNYLDNTELCAQCHVTHSAEQAKLLKEKTVEDLCRTCHGLANTGSRYNVDTGEIVVAGERASNGLITAVSFIPSNSGAFGVPAGGRLLAGNHAATWNGAEVTSSHSTSSSNSYIAPGGGDREVKLTCTSCHRSHPKKNSYRLMQIGDVKAFAVNATGLNERVNYLEQMNTGCGCHRQYIVPGESGHVADITNYYRHSVGVALQGPYASINPKTNVPWSLTTTLPTEYYDNAGHAVASLTTSGPVKYVENGAIFCGTCHYAHGTIATGASPSSYDLNGDGLLNDESTMLKRLKDNDACQNCHHK